MISAPGRSATFRRRVQIATRPGLARAVVEDDFHHFRVEIEHAGGSVVRADCEALRYPYTTCPMAAGPLSELVGMSLSEDATAVRHRADQLHQCTHMFDLAGLAIAAAARGIARRDYAASIPDRIEGQTRPTLTRDGTAVLAWDVMGHFIRGPAPYAGVGLRAGFVEWARQNLAPEAAEAAVVLRRAVFVSGGRGWNYEAHATAPPKGGCYTQQPQRALLARRVAGSVLDFTQRAQATATADMQWLGSDGGETR